MQDIQTALEEYFTEWKAWSAGANEFAFANLKPMHAGWKVGDEAALGAAFSDFLPRIQQAHLGTVDKRKIILAVNNEPVVGVPVLQLMQLRPGSTDPLGLDHVAFYCADMEPLVEALKKRSEKWEEQSNPGHKWISMWFGPNAREVKFFDHTSLDLGSRELAEASAKIKS